MKRFFIALFVLILLWLAFVGHKFTEDLPEFQKDIPEKSMVTLWLASAGWPYAQLEIGVGYFMKYSLEKDKKACWQKLYNARKSAYWLKKVTWLPGYSANYLLGTIISEQVDSVYDPNLANPCEEER